MLLAAYVIMGRGLGASGAFSTLVSATVAKVAPAHAAGNEFYGGYLGDGGSNMGCLRVSSGPATDLMAPE